MKIGPINAATITPLNLQGTLDEPSLKRLAAHWQAIGLDGVMLLGTMGEGRFLAESVRDAMVEQSLAHAGDKLAVFVSIADLSRERMIERARRCAGQGVEMVVLCLPPGASPRVGVQDVLAVAEAAPIPCAYYEIPANTGVALVRDELLQIMRHPNIQVLKDSTENSLLGHVLNAATQELKSKWLLDGAEYCAAYSRLLGYQGLLHGGGTLTARRIRKIWELTGLGRVSEAIKLERENALFLAQIYNRFSRPLQNIVGQKYALKLLGVLDSEACVSDQQLADQDRARIAAAVEAQRSELLG